MTHILSVLLLFKLIDEISSFWGFDPTPVVDYTIHIHDYKQLSIFFEIIHVNKGTIHVNEIITHPCK